MRAVFKFAVARLSEPTTWRGLFLLATAAGVQMAPELQAAIVAAGLAAAGLIGVVTKEPAAPAFAGPDGPAAARGVPPAE